MKNIEALKQYCEKRDIKPLWLDRDFVAMCNWDCPHYTKATKRCDLLLEWPGNKCEPVMNKMWKMLNEMDAYKEAYLDLIEMKCSHGIKWKDLCEGCHSPYMVIIKEDEDDQEN